MKSCPYCGTENRYEESFCEQCGGCLDSVTAITNQGESGDASNAHSLAPGSQLQNDRYVINNILGQGGMGSVALATDTRLADKLVVIKELIAEHADLTEEVRNFTREVQTLAHLDYPLIPSVTDHFQEGSRYFMVQEYVEGENLEALLERTKRPMEEQDALIPISILCGKMKERNLCLYTMWKGMNSINGTSNHTSGLASVSG